MNLENDEPDRDNCDLCGCNAWEGGIPSWTCDHQLFCSTCYDVLIHMGKYENFMESK